VLDRATVLGYTLPSVGQQVKQNQLVLDLKAAGVWAKLDVMYVFATDGSSDFATLNWKNPSAHQCAVVGTLNFTTNSGFRSVLNTNFNPATSGVNYTLNDAGRFMWISASGSNAFDGLDVGFANSLFSSTSASQRINMSTTALNASVAMAGTGWRTINRTSSTNVELFVGLTQNSRTATSVSVVSANQFIQKADASLGTMRHAFYAMGASLVSENTDFYNAFNTYLTSL
jgi:hypothetical protein